MGGMRTIISAEIARHFNLPVDKYGREFLQAANQGKIDCIGSVILRASVNAVTVTLNTLVSRSLSDEILISWHDLINMRAIPANFPHAQC